MRGTLKHPWTFLTWGMMASWRRRASSPMRPVSTPSSRMRPEVTSMRRNSVSMSEDLPLPVLPTTPQLAPAWAVSHSQSALTHQSNSHSSNDCCCHSGHTMPQLAPAWAESHSQSALVTNYSFRSSILLLLVEAQHAGVWAAANAHTDVNSYVTMYWISSIM